MSETKNAQARSNAKMRYARLHLDELRTYARRGSGDDFERSHQESFLYHLFGARDAFLQELNLYYECGLKLHQVRVSRLQKVLDQKGVCSPELDEVISLEHDEGSWLHIAKEMRDHSTHRRSVPREFYAGGAENGQVHFKHPNSGRTIKKDYVPLFESWCNEMKQLLEGLRRSGWAVYQSKNAPEPRQ